MLREARTQAKETPRATFEIPTDLDLEGVAEITTALRRLLADTFALYLKTKNFHWHMSGQHFRDYHLLLDEQSEQIFAMTDDIAERTREIGGAGVALDQRHFTTSTLEGQQRGEHSPERNARRAQRR
jgi:starvation-inducible DNA-binding protein